MLPDNVFDFVVIKKHSRKPCPLSATRWRPCKLELTVLKTTFDTQKAMTDKQASNQNFMRTVALTIVVVGAVGSLYFMFDAGRNQKSILLITLFTAWVLSPFVGLFLANKISNRWTVSARASLYWLMIILTIGSLIAYSGALIPPNTKAAFIFLVVPLLSWVLIVTVFLIARKISRKSNDTNQT
jgi:hypothetical protein